MLRILAAAAALCLGLAANAADKGGPVSRVMAQEQPSGNEWNRTGFYLGAVGGYSTLVLEAEGLDLANGKLMLGGVAGFNARVSPQLVLGVEGDWIFTDVSASTTVEGITVTTSSRHLISLRARAGVPVGPALLYLTAGPAWQQAKLSATDGVALVSDREWQLGAVGGGGIELELTRSLAVRLEALHYIFPRDGAPLEEFLRSDNQQTTARAGVIFKLN
jgi:outer membrane immunogenic protein